MLFLVSASVSEAATFLEKPISEAKSQEDETSRRHEKKGLSITTKSATQRAATAPLRANVSSPIGMRSCSRMPDYSLSFHAKHLSQNNPNQQTSFDNLLRMEEKRLQKSTKPPITVSPSFMGIVGSALLFALSALVWDPSSARALWKSVLHKKIGTILAVAWLPWCWYHPAKLALVDLLILIQLVQQPAVLPYLQKQVFPILWKTFYSMMVTEAWTRAWKHVFSQMDLIRQHVVAEYYQGGKEENKKDEESWKDGHLVWPDPPSWLVDLHGAVVGSVRKGIKSAMKKSVQETISSAFLVWTDALQEQILLSAEWK